MGSGNRHRDNIPAMYCDSNTVLFHVRAVLTAVQTVLSLFEYH